MSQIRRTELFRAVMAEIEQSIKERIYSEMVIGGLLQEIKPEELYISRKFNVNELDAPSLFVTRAPVRSIEVSARTVSVISEYHFVPIVESFDFVAAEEQALGIADNVVDMFISQGDRSLGEKIYDVKHVETSPVFPYPEADRIFFSVARLSFDYMKRTA